MGRWARCSAYGMSFVWCTGHWREPRITQDGGPVRHTCGAGCAGYSDDPPQKTIVGWGRPRREIVDYGIDCLLKRLDTENIWS
jgi:hypothetical protein